MIKGKNFLTAAFLDGSVTVCGSTFPAGQFSVFLLNRYYEHELGGRLAVFREYNRMISKQLMYGYLNTNYLEKAGEEIRQILRVLPELKPFDLLDTESERRRIDTMFTDENAECIREYFMQRAITGTMDDGFVTYDRFPWQYDKAFCEQMREFIEELQSVLRFYNTLGEGSMFAHEKLRAFISGLDEISCLDEAHLLPLALEVFGTNSVSAEVEYIPLQRAGKEGVSVGRQMHFDSYSSFLLTDFFEGLHHGHYPRRCAVCKRYFLMTDARHQQYCTGMAPERYRGKEISCRNLAAVRKRKERAKNDPITARYDSRCSAIRVEQSRGIITEEFAQAAKKLAKEHKQRAVQSMQYANTKYAADLEREKLYADVDARWKR